MRKALALAALGAVLYLPLPALAQDTAEALKGRFTVKEQVLLAGVLTDAEQAGEFAEDANAGATEAVLTKWRARIALFARDYLSKDHPVNLQARSIKEMGEPAEWAILWATLQVMKKEESIKFSIFSGMILSADDALKAEPRDTSEAQKVIGMARPELVKALKEYSESDVARKALEQHERSQQLAQKAKTAKEQAEKILGQNRKAAGAKTDEQAKAGSGTGYTKEKASGETAPAVSGKTGSTDPSSESSDSTLLAKKPSSETVHRPNLRAEPPKPETSGDDEMAELRKMKKEVAGGKALWAGIAGGVVGGVIGFLLAGIVGAVVGAIALGAAAFAATKKLFG